MGASKVLKMLEEVKIEKEFTPSCVKEETFELLEKIEEFKEEAFLSEGGGNDALSLYLKQVRCFPFLSAENEKSLCKGIKQRERELVGTIAQWCDLIVTTLNEEDRVPARRAYTHHGFLMTLQDSGNGTRSLRAVLLQLEKINALKKKMQQIKCVLSGSGEKTPRLAMWREAKEKNEAEISKLISRVKLDSEKVTHVLYQLEKEITRGGAGAAFWERNRKELGDLLNTISKKLWEIRNKKSKLIQPYLIIVPYVARRYSNRGMDILDLIQEGNQGLMRAADTFDYRKGNRFISYAIWWIRQSIIRTIHNQSRTIRIPVYLFDRLNHFLTASEQLFKDRGREPALGELAEQMELNRDELGEITRIFKFPASLDELNQLERGKSGENDHDGSILGAAIQSDLKRKIDSYLTHLSPREEEIIRLRYGIDGSQDEHSLQAIGQKFNLSRERIRQIERCALMKLKKMKHIHELREFLT